MSIAALRDSIKDYAKDTRLNLGSVLSEEGAPGLKINQIFGVALSCAYATKDERIIEAIEEEAKDKVSEEEVQAAKSAATIMAMNNVYYRFLHLSEHAELKKLPAKLRMTVIGKPGIDKVDFELYSLAVSALNGCGSCIASHIKQAEKGGISTEGVQSTARIAAVIEAAHQAVSIG